MILDCTLPLMVLLVHLLLLFWLTVDFFSIFCGNILCKFNYRLILTILRNALDIL